MKKIATITGWIAIAAFIAFSVDYISSLPDQAQRADWGIAKDSPIRR